MSSDTHQNTSKFACAINCMDGRVQDAVKNYMKSTYGVDWVDQITEPGPNKILCECKDCDKSVVDDIKKTWQDTYKTKNGIDMYYQYEYTPKTIGVILLDSYFDYFPGYEYSKPAFIQIWYSINGTALSKNDSFVLEAKKELNKIADSFKLVKPDP